MPLLMIHLRISALPKSWVKSFEIERPIGVKNQGVDVEGVRKQMKMGEGHAGSLDGVVAVCS